MKAKPEKGEPEENKTVNTASTAKKTDPVKLLPARFIKKLSENLCSLKALDSRISAGIIWMRMASDPNIGRRLAVIHTSEPGTMVQHALMSVLMNSRHMLW